MFKKLRSLALPYEKQGLIYFTCLNYDDMPLRVQKKIDQLCIEAGGSEYYQALKDVVTGKKTITQAARDCPCGQSTLNRKRMRFYKSWH